MANRKLSGSSPPLFLMQTTTAPLWIRQLLTEDFAPCKADRFCVPCTAAFCNHTAAPHITAARATRWSSTLPSLTPAHKLNV
ncbi:hypothetical protein EJB05_06555, partial [Eragrostis curvula]